MRCRKQDFATNFFFINRRL